MVHKKKIASKEASTPTVNNINTTIYNLNITYNIVIPNDMGLRDYAGQVDMNAVTEAIMEHFQGTGYLQELSQAMSTIKISSMDEYDASKSDD
jgi:hypothetical protein